MKAITLLSCSLAFIVPQLAFADQRVLVPGHQNPDGTYTAPYVTVVPDDTTATTTSTDSNVVITPQSTGTVIVNPNNQVNAVEAGVIQGGTVNAVGVGAVQEGYRGGVNGAAAHGVDGHLNGQLQHNGLGEGNRGARDNGLGREGHGGAERRR